MHLTGVILDIYDDPNCTVLMSKVGSALPKEIGDIELLDESVLATYPDRFFGLVATNDGDVIRKFAMLDEGHLTTSIIYFLETGHLLPEAARKTAARNMVAACQFYNMEPPSELVKQANVIDAAFGALDVKSRMENAHNASRSTMEGFRAAQAGATSDMQKHADLNGTEMMPMSGSISTLDNGRSTIRGGASSGASKRAAWSHAGDITAHQPVVTEPVKVAHFAMPSEERYPIDSYDSVKTASAYFDEHYTSFDLEARREFAVNLAGRMNELGMPLTDNLLKYAGFEYGDHINVELASRVRNFEGTEHEGLYEVLAEKIASTPPHVMLEMIHLMDNETGAAGKYDAPLGFRDPFHAVYGKVAAEEKGPWSWSHHNDYVNEDQLRDLALNRYQSLDRAFGMDMRKSFQSDPIGIFMSMADPQKVVIARLASDDSKG